MGIAENLKYLRKNNGYTINDIVEKIDGVSRTSYKNWENGTSEPYIKNLKKICEIYNVSIDMIVSEDLEDKQVIRNQLKIPDFNISPQIGESEIYAETYMQLAKELIEKGYDENTQMTSYDYGKLFYYLYGADMNGNYDAWEMLENITNQITAYYISIDPDFYYRILKYINYISDRDDNKAWGSDFYIYRPFMVTYKAK